MPVTTQLILIVTAVILPMNVVSLVYAVHVRNSYIERSIEADVSIAETYLDHLSQRMEAADDFMARDIYDNVYIARISRAKTRNDDAVNRR